MTSRRTSRPRTGKHSDPTNKGKGKEKRPIEEESESGSGPKLEEALHKEKEDEERRVELRRLSEASKSNRSTEIETIPREEIERIDENIWANQVVTKIQDDMNPKLKKRKREPVVPHAFEIATGIESQVANMTARINTRLTSLIEHMSDMIKRAIDKALAQVHIKIQDLEHRVSELEGIGAREALAALKADISKVKKDVQQLQPDLSIFNAQLPEDEVFENEREEIDEEEPEEDHVTKNLDEE
ncbi:hypothetical protein HAX54_000097 [Datura stramonium]|uniref:Uncharacterized protein n=1 Tax=Datura stramonium TaxID=4076 RepID=A0ABS8RHZ7_DATST|nr:hypothetical protein [Datura stramonium]